MGCTSFPRTFPPTLTTTALDCSSLEGVWDLLLKTDPEGPTLINCTARSRLIRSCDLLIRVLLQHTNFLEPDFVGVSLSLPEPIADYRVIS
jgi:hypothetical protein